MEIQEDSLEKKLDSLIIEIADYLSLKSRDIDDYSLDSGQTGILLFFSYLRRFPKNESYRATALNLLENIVKALNMQGMKGTFMDGCIGFAWLIQHLHNSNFITLTEGNNAFLNKIDEIIPQLIEIETKKKNIDLFSGLVGLGVYLLERPQNASINALLEMLVSGIDSISEIDEKGARWLDYNSMNFYSALKEEGQLSEEVNLGLAHGMAAIINLLSKIYSAGIRKERIEYLLKGAIGWLWEQQDAEAYPFLFFNTSAHRKSRHARLAWCNGDLGIAIALINAGKNLNRPEWINKGIDLSLRTTSIKHTDTIALVEDVTFCHGATGLVYIYHQLYHYSKEVKFKQTSNYWLDVLFKMRKKENSHDSIGFYTKTTDENQKSINIEKPGLLFGITGIGLTLLGIKNNEPMEWERCLLLS